jgi:hypothetical protein
VANYYDAGVIGYLFDGSSMVDQKAGSGTGLAEAYPKTTSVHQGDTYTLYSEHYLIAYYYTPGLGYSNPYNYYPGNGFAPGDPGYAPGYSFSSGGGPGIVQQQTIYLGYTYLQFSTAPPHVLSISPQSVVRGTSGSFYLQGTNLQDDFGVFTVRALDGDSISVAWSAQSSASLSYTIAAGATVGTHRFTVSNTWGESEPVSFTVVSGWPVNPCQVSSSPQSAYSSIASTGTVGGSGTVTVSFSGAAYSAVSQTVSYGPYSTPSSIASNIAALITANYTRYGLTARASGPAIVYSGNNTVGTVNHVITGPSITTTTSSTAEASAEAACGAAPPTPSAACSGPPNKDYILAVLHDSVTWVYDPESLDTGRVVGYSLLHMPTQQYLNGAPLPDNDLAFQSTVTEHLSVPMAFGSSSSGKFSGQFTDVLGRTVLGIASGTYSSDRCFTVTLNAPKSPTGPSIGWVQSFDYTGGKRTMHSFDTIYVNKTTSISILNGYTDANGQPKSVNLP